jgi:arsenate reductase (thioredoxin)
LFVGLEDTGRGQMAAALLTLRSEGRVVAHSAGSSAGVRLDPGVIEVMGELGVDLSEAYAKPLVSEVFAAADLVVTAAASAQWTSRRARGRWTGGSATRPAPR